MKRYPGEGRGTRDPQRIAAASLKLHRASPNWARQVVIRSE